MAISIITAGAKIAIPRIGEANVKNPVENSVMMIEEKRVELVNSAVVRM